MSEADRILRAACGERFTAAVLRVERRGRPVFESAYGTVDDAGVSAPVEVTTCFDLASLTKVFAGATALRAVAAGKLTLDEALVSLVPEWCDKPHAAITLRMLLAHTSGMQSGADYRELIDEDVESYALRRELVAAPGQGVVYSDLGFIALGTILARANGHALPVVIAETCRAVGAKTTGFRPAARERAFIPATECDEWRGRVHGVVHDEKAYLMGGVAGHAGLFGSAYDVARLTDAFLAVVCGRAYDEHALPAGLAREALVEQGADLVLRRGLGWALKTTGENSCGSLMSHATFGHTGFTGTSVWADPERDLSIVLLTNAVYFGRGDLRDLRVAVSDAVVNEVDG